MSIRRNASKSIWLSLVAMTSQAAIMSQSFAQVAEPVNPLIGTGGSTNLTGSNSGQDFPGATTPFGMVRLSPDTRFSNAVQHAVEDAHVGSSGYNFRHDRFLGFSHTRQSGTGGKVGGLFRVHPLTHPDSFERRGALLKVHHDADQEIASPGFYSLAFPEEGFRAELTASPHCGFHRYVRTDSSKNLYLLVEGGSSLSGNDAGDASRIQVAAQPRMIEGMTEWTGGNRGLKAYFHAEYSEKASMARVWSGNSWLEGSQRSATGKKLGVGLAFGPEISEVGFTLCMSYVSMANARLNFVTEARGKSFDLAQQGAEAMWHEMLGRVEAKSSDPDVLVNFYTGIYHAMIMPTRFADVNGQYVGFDQKIHVAQDFNYLTDFSLWDTFRTVHPLYTLIAPEVQRDSVKSLLEMAKIDGSLPQFPNLSWDALAMIGTPANFLMSEAYQKGIRDFDSRAALNFMVKDGREGGPSHEKACIDKGYCPFDQVEGGAVSKTQEYAWSNYSVARMAEAMGENAIAREFDLKAMDYRNVWNPGTGYFAPRKADGSFVRSQPRLPLALHVLDRNSNAFREGSGWQWRFAVPHQGKDLVRLFGGSETFVKELEKFMEVGTRRGRADFIASEAYWAGNEHDMHAIYLFNEAGRPELTQKWARWAMDNRYANLPSGLDGNDDAGAISAWYSLSALGLYPQAGTDRYWLGSPRLEEARLNLGSGNSLLIQTSNQSKQNVYVQSVSLNGRRLCEPMVRHSELQNATLVFAMGSAPAVGGGYSCDSAEN